MANTKHGQDQLAKNAIINWSAQFITIIAGFILPRIISDTIGKEELGIWDFAWSMVSYFRLISGGVVSSINRFIAKYNAVDDNKMLNEFVSTAAVVVRAMGVIILMVSILYLVAPFSILSHGKYELLSRSRYPVFLIGIGIAIEISASVYSGLLTGSHRWDIYNYIKVATLFLSLVLSIIALKAGGGIIHLAVCQMGAESAGRFAVMIVTRRYFPDLKINLKLFRREVAKNIIVFSSKSYINVIAAFLSNQTVSVLVGGVCGPAVLAVFMRPRSLLRRVGTLVQKYAMLLVPTVSSLQAVGDMKGIRDIALSATTFAISVGLPIITTIMLLSKDILQIWMGDGYNSGFLTAIIGLGTLFEISYMPLYRIMLGMNQHGRLVSINLITSACAVLFTFLTLKYHTFNMEYIGLAITVPVIISQGVIVPVISCRVLKVSIVKFLVDVWKKPVLCLIPYLGLLMVLRNLTGVTLYIKMVLLLSVGFILIISAYWLILFSPEIKLKVINKIQFLKKE